MALVPRTWLEVIPYIRQWTPPELKATFPPIVQMLWLEGSGAKWSPKGRAAVLTAVGPDEVGRFVLANFAREGVATDFIRTIDGTRTGAGTDQAVVQL